MTSFTPEEFEKRFEEEIAKVQLSYDADNAHEIEKIEMAANAIFHAARRAAGLPEIESKKNVTTDNHE